MKVQSPSLGTRKTSTLLTSKPHFSNQIRKSTQICQVSVHPGAITVNKPPRHLGDVRGCNLPDFPQKVSKSPDFLPGSRTKACLSHDGYGRKLLAQLPKGNSKSAHARLREHGYSSESPNSTCPSVPNKIYPPGCCHALPVTLLAAAASHKT